MFCDMCVSTCLLRRAVTDPKRGLPSKRAQVGAHAASQHTESLKISARWWSFSFPPATIHPLSQRTEEGVRCLSIEAEKDHPAPRRKASMIKHRKVGGGAKGAPKRHTHTHTGCGTVQSGTRRFVVDGSTRIRSRLARFSFPPTCLLTFAWLRAVAARPGATVGSIHRSWFTWNSPPLHWFRQRDSLAICLHNSIDVHKD